MPFAGFQNFADCVAKQIVKGRSEESAKRICGALMHRFEGKSVEKTGSYKSFEQWGGEACLNVDVLAEDEQKEYYKIVSGLDTLADDEIDVLSDGELADTLKKYATLDGEEEPEITECFITGEDEDELVSAADMLTYWTKQSMRGLGEHRIIKEKQAIKHDQRELEFAQRESARAIGQLKQSVEKTAVGTTQQQNELGQAKWSHDLSKIEIVEPPYPPELLSAFLECDETHFRSLLPGTILLVNGSAKKVEHVLGLDKVLSHDGTYQKVTELLPHRIDEEIYDIQVQGVPVTSATHEHPFLALPADACKKRAEFTLEYAHSRAAGEVFGNVPDRQDLYQNLSWIDSNQLEVGGYIASPVPKLGEGVKYVVAAGKKLQASPAFFRVLGLFIAEGCVYSGKESRSPQRPRYETSWAFHEDELEYQREIVQFLDSIGYVGTISSVSGRGVKVCTTSRVIHNIFLELGGKYSQGRRIPGRLLQTLSGPQAIILLQAYFDGDGYYCAKTHRIAGITTSEVWAWQCFYLLSALKYRPSIKKRVPKNGSPAWVLSLMGDDVDQFQKGEGGVGSNHKKKSIFTTVEGVEYLLRPIQAISRRVYEGMVYNFEVEGTNSYAANGVCSHNCVRTKVTDSVCRDYQLVPTVTVQPDADSTRDDEGRPVRPKEGMPPVPVQLIGVADLVIGDPSQAGRRGGINAPGLADADVAGSHGVGAANRSQGFKSFMEKAIKPLEPGGGDPTTQVGDRSNRKRLVTQDQIDEQVSQIEDFIEDANDIIGFEGVLDRACMDYEAIGWSAIEVIRSVDMKVRRIAHAPAVRMKVLKGWKGFVEIISNDRSDGSTVYGGKYVYYQNFGSKVVSKRTHPITGVPLPYDPSIDGEISPATVQWNLIDRETGDSLEPSVENLGRAANEIIWIPRHHANTVYYGYTDVVPSLGWLLQNVHIRDYGLQFFEHNTVPRYAIIIEGAKLAEPVKKTITQYFSTHVKGKAHKTLIVPIPSMRGEVKVRFEKLDADNRESSFQDTKKNNSQSIMTAHGVSPAIIGIAEHSELGSGKGLSQAEIYKDRIVTPSQRYWARKLNLLFKRGLGITLTALRFNPLDIRDERAEMEVLTGYLFKGCTTINEVRRKAGLGPPLPGGDRPFILMGNVIMFVDEMTEASGTEREELMAEVEGIKNDMALQKIGVEKDRQMKKKLNDKKPSQNSKSSQNSTNRTEIGAASKTTTVGN